MKVFYHGDMDGIASGYLLCKNIIPKQTVVDAKKAGNNFIEFDYNKQQNLMNMYLNHSENVYFVDCSPDEEVLNYILDNAAGVFIIDHHISRKDMLERYFKEGKINGMFYNGASATLITYCWINMILKDGKTIAEVKEFLDWFGLSKLNQERSSEIPLSIKLINSWDIWNGFYIDAEPYKIAFETQKLSPLDFETFNDLLYNERVVSNTIKKGYIMKKQINSWAETFMERYGYEVSYNGNSFFVANLGNGNSKYFGERIKDYDAVIAYCYNGDLWTMSIYSDSSKDFDCSEFAKKFSGGGHKKAAGFRTTEFPSWLKPQKTKE